MNIVDDRIYFNSQPYKYSGKELDTSHGLNLYDFSARHYDGTVPRFTTVDPLAEKHYSWSPYVYCLNNPLRFIDPDGRTEEERLAAIAQIKQYIGKAYSEMDCSETVDRAVRVSTSIVLKKGKGVDKEDGTGKWDNGVALIVANSREVNSFEEMEVGNTVTFRSGRKDHKGEDGKFDHIGMVTDITRDDDGNVTSFSVIHSASKGVREQAYDAAKGTKGMPGYELKGIQAWDTPGNPQPKDGGTLPQIIITGHYDKKPIITPAPISAKLTIN